MSLLYYFGLMLTKTGYVLECYQFLLQIRSRGFVQNCEYYAITFSYFKNKISWLIDSYSTYVTLLNLEYTCINME